MEGASNTRGLWSEPPIGTDVFDAADALGTSAAVIWNWVDTGRVPSPVWDGVVPVFGAPWVAWVRERGVQDPGTYPVAPSPWGREDEYAGKPPARVRRAAARQARMDQYKKHESGAGGKK